MALKEDDEQERKVYSCKGMTEAEKLASEYIDGLIEMGPIECFSFHVRLSVMIESLNALLDILVEDERYERAALYRDVIKELKRYENGGDKYSDIDSFLLS